MLGDVWEWTTSPLRPWPGFTPMIYASYSQPFFGGDYQVLRGGSWAVAPNILRPSFRNWDHPIRRQIFSGHPAWSVDGTSDVPTPRLAGTAAVARRLVLEPPSGLLVQSYAPRREDGLMNADGWGVGFSSRPWCGGGGGPRPVG